MIENNKTSKIEYAFSLFSGGKNQLALKICNTLLKKNKNDINALNLIGIIKDKLNQKEDAITYFKMALKLTPDNTLTLVNIGITSFEMNKMSDAKKYFEKALLLNPLCVDALFNLANISFSKKDYENAINWYNKTIEASPNHIHALNNLGNIYHKMQYFETAEEHYLSALKLNSDFVDSLIGITCVHLEDNKLESAFKFGVRALSQVPDNLQTLLLLGKISSRLSNTNQAINFYFKASSIAPDNIFSYLELARIYIDAESFDAGKTVIEKALLIDNNNAAAHNFYGFLIERTSKDIDKSLFHFIKSFEIDPTQAELACNIGKAYIAKGDFETAKLYMERSVELEPDNAITLGAWGVIFQEFGNNSQAQVLYEKAIEINPNCANIHSNIGFLFIRMCKLEDANTYLQKAIDIEPENQSAQNNMSVLKLLIKDFKNGWKHFRYRNAVQAEKYEFPPEKSDNSLIGKNVLILGEQGIGDELFYLRFMKKLKSLGTTVSYLPCKRLIPILQSLNIVDQLLNTMPDKNNYDMCISVGDLPYLLDHKKSTTPPPLPLKLNNKSVEQVRNVLKKFGSPPYIGVTWRAGGIVNNRRTGSYLKEIDLASLCSILRARTGTIIAIQKNATQSEFNYISEQLQRPVLDASIYHGNLENMLALLSLIDTYITVSNTNLHMREGLKKKSHVLVCSPPEWRWIESGRSSLWFPNSSVYRQLLDESWENAVNELTHQSSL